MGVLARLSLLLLLVLYVCTSTAHAKGIKKPFHHHGLHHHYYELIGLIAFKAKAAFVVGSIVILLFLMKGFGMFNAYRCPKTSGHEIVHYSSPTHEESPPLYHHDYDRYSKGGRAQRRNDQGQNDPEEQLFGFDLVDTSFKIVDIRSETCRRKFVCDVDRAAHDTPILNYILKYFGNGLNRYRDGDEPDLNRTCQDIYPDCPGLTNGEKETDQEG